MTERVPRAAPPERSGPRPLALHLVTAQATWLGSLAALPMARLGLIPWSPELAPKAAKLAAALAASDPEALTRAVAEEALGRLDEMARGIEGYHRHPYRRRGAEPPAVWRQGTTRLLDYGATHKRARDGYPALVVPSLVNRAYVLDLMPGASLLRGLAARGLRPFLVDWGEPGPEERGFTLSDYIAGRLEAALDATLDVAGGPPALIGYCMGGNLALALAQRRGRDLRRLALLATPWDFHRGHEAQARMVGLSVASVEPVLRALGVMPVDMLQACFAALDPNLAGRKFRAFARLDPAGREAAHFVALEDWLNDGVPLAAAVARECLAGWYGENTPARKAWRVAGEVVDPARVALPAIVAVPERDRIVPPESARALAEALPEATLLTPPSGHIGMVVGRRAREGLWRPLADWLKEGWAGR